MNGFYDRMIIRKFGDVFMLRSDKVIYTKNLELRCFTLDDWDYMMELRSDPLNSPFAPNDIWKNDKKAKEFFDFATQFYDDNPNSPDWYVYFLSIREKENDKVIGYCGIGAPEFNRDLVEVFYSLTKDKWNNGYATECAKAMLEFGFDEIGLDKIIGYIHPDNSASRRVLEKVGLKEVGILDYIPLDNNFYGNVLFEITRDEYINNR